MNWIAVVGTLAALCSTISFVPQVWRIVRTRETGAISPVTYSLTVTGFALWTAYGIGLRDWPLILTNSICFVLSAFILLMTLLPQVKKGCGGGYDRSGSVKRGMGTRKPDALCAGPLTCPP